MAAASAPHPRPPRTSLRPPPIRPGRRRPRERLPRRWQPRRRQVRTGATACNPRDRLGSGAARPKALSPGLLPPPEPKPRARASARAHSTTTTAAARVTQWNTSRERPRASADLLRRAPRWLHTLSARRGATVRHPHCCHRCMARRSDRHPSTLAASAACPPCFSRFLPPRRGQQHRRRACCPRASRRALAGWRRPAASYCPAASWGQRPAVPWLGPTVAAPRPLAASRCPAARWCRAVLPRR